MTLDELIRLVEARLSAMNVARATAAAVGDVAQVMRIDAEVAETQATLDRLKTLVV
jgi:hypothetical protein